MTKNNSIAYVCEKCIQKFARQNIGRVLTEEEIDMVHKALSDFKETENIEDAIVNAIKRLN